MQIIHLLILFLIFYLIPSAILGSEDVLVCAKFRENYRWSRGHELNALITKGNALNKSYKTHDYHVYSTYVLIYLDDDEPYIIELDSSYLLGDGSVGEDQYGKRWKISKSDICY